MEPKNTSMRDRHGSIKAASALGLTSALGFPYISLAQNKPIRIGMPTILSGRVAQLGISSRNAVEMEKFNAAGGWGDASPSSSFLRCPALWAG